MKCQRCGRELSDVAAFCEFCGEAVQQTGQYMGYQQQNVYQPPKKKKSVWIIIGVLLSLIIVLIAALVTVAYVTEDNISVVDQSDLSEDESSLKTEMKVMIEDLEQNYNSMETVTSYIDAMEDQYKEYYSKKEINQYFKYMKDYMELRDSVGEYQETGAFSVQSDEERISQALLEVKFEKGNLVLCYTLSDDEELPMFEMKKETTTFFDQIGLAVRKIWNQMKTCIA